MLQKLNERIQGMIAWIVIVLIAVTFTLFGVDYYMQARQVADVEVTVNGEAVSKQAYEVNYRRIRQQREYEKVASSNDSALKKQVLEDMIVNLITVQSASKEGFLVANGQANGAILNIPQFQQDGQFSTERYQQALSAAMYTPESFQNQVRQGMLLNQQRFAFMGGAFALPNEISRFVKLYMQTRDYDYLIIPSEQFKNAVQLSSLDISQYYEKHKKMFIAPEKVSIDYIRLSMQQIKDQIKLSAADLQRYYQDNETNFLTPAQWQVETISLAIPDDASLEQKNAIKVEAYDLYHSLQQKPMEFSQKRNELNEKALIKEGQVEKSDALSWVVAGTTSYDKVLARLSKPGSISSPLKTDNDYKLFKLVAYKKASLKPFNEVKDEIMSQLTTELAQARYTQILEQLTDLSYQSPDSLLPVAQELNLPVEKSSLFSKDSVNRPFSQNTQVVNAAFSHDVLDLGNNSEPIQLDNDSVIVLRVNQHVPVTQKKLADVRDQIVIKLTLRAAQKEAKSFGLSLLGTSDRVKEQNMITQHQLAWTAVKNAARDSDESDPLISSLAFNLPRAHSQDGVSLTNGDYAIVRLNQLHDGKYQDLDKEQQASLVQQIEASYGVMDYDLYINSLVAAAHIDRH